MFDLKTILISLFVVVVSLVIQKMFKTFVAYKLGDHLPALTKDSPFSYLDFVGSFLIPILLSFTSGFVVGWTKPISYSQTFFSRKKASFFLLSISGPILHFFMASLGVIVILFYVKLFGFDVDVVVRGGESLNLFIDFVERFSVLNFLLCFFHFFPLPSLDGFALMRWFPSSVSHWMYKNTNMLLSLVVVFLFLFSYFFDTISFIAIGESFFNFFYSFRVQLFF